MTIAPARVLALVALFSSSHAGDPNGKNCTYKNEMYHSHIKFSPVPDQVYTLNSIGDDDLAFTVSSVNGTFSVTTVHLQPVFKEPEGYAQHMTAHFSADPAGRIPSWTLLHGLTLNGTVRDGDCGFINWDWDFLPPFPGPYQGTGLTWLSGPSRPHRLGR